MNYLGFSQKRKVHLKSYENIFKNYFNGLKSRNWHSFGRKLDEKQFQLCRPRDLLSQLLTSASEAWSAATDSAQTVPKRTGVSVFQRNLIYINTEIWSPYTFHMSWTILLNSSPQLFKNAKIILSLWSWKTGWLTRFTPTGCSLPTTTVLNLHLWLKKSSHCGVQTSKGARTFI